MLTAEQLKQRGYVPAQELQWTMLQAVLMSQGFAWRHVVEPSGEEHWALRDDLWLRVERYRGNPQFARVIDSAIPGLAPVARGGA